MGAEVQGLWVARTKGTELRARLCQALGQGPCMHRPCPSTLTRLFSGSPARQRERGGAERPQLGLHPRHVYTVSAASWMAAA